MRTLKTSELILKHTEKNELINKTKIVVLVDGLLLITMINIFKK